VVLDTLKKRLKQKDAFGKLLVLFKEKKNNKPNLWSTSLWP
jgi:hypothetical protein